MPDRHAHLADFALRQRMIAVVSGLGGQIYSNRESVLAFGEIGAIERIRRRSARMPRIGAENPRPVLLRHLRILIPVFHVATAFLNADDAEDAQTARWKMGRAPETRKIIFCVHRASPASAALMAFFFAARLRVRRIIGGANLDRAHLLDAAMQQASG